MIGVPDGVSEQTLAAAAGLLGGLVLGLAARRARFCTLGAIEDAIYADDLARARMWALAAAVAIAATFGLDALGATALDQTFYALNAWNPVASVVGGLTFGYGMALAGNCGFTALARAGGGDLKSVVILLVMAVASYVVVSGPLASARVAVFELGPADPGGSLGYAHAIADLLSLPPLAPAVLVAVAIGAWALRSRSFRADRLSIGWAVAVGAAIAFGWWATGWLARTGFEALPVESYTFTGPLGETLLYAMTSSGGGLSFSVGSVFGVVLGGFLGSWSQSEFRWEACEDPRELGRQMFGAILMGFGGVVAVGCSVGQGLTAASTLTFSAPIVVGAIILGAALGLRQLIEGVSPTRSLAMWLGFRHAD